MSEQPEHRRDPSWRKRGSPAIGSVGACPTVVPIRQPRCTTASIPGMPNSRRTTITLDEDDAAFLRSLLQQSYRKATSGYHALLPEDQVATLDGHLKRYERILAQLQPRKAPLPTRSIPTVTKL